MNIISVIRCAIFYLYENKNKKIPIYYLIVLVIMIIILGIISYDGIFSLLPTIITLIYTISIYQDNDKVIRISYTICGILWVFYNYEVGAYTIMIGNVVEVISGFVSILRYRYKK